MHKPDDVKKMYLTVDVDTEIDACKCIVNV